MAVRKHGTLVATTVASIDLTGKARFVEVLARGTGDIFFTIDGTTPTVAGDDTHAVAAAGGYVRVRNHDPDTTTTVKMISSGTPGYSIGLVDENLGAR